MCKKFILTVVFLYISSCHTAWAQENFIIQVNGISNQTAQKNVEERLNQQQKDLEQPLTTDKIQTFMHDAPRNIEEALKPFGYFHPHITHQLIQNNANWRAIFQIQPGPPTYIDQLNIGITGPAKNDPAFQKLLMSTPLRKGNQLNTQQYDQLKKELLDIAQIRGYLAAKFVKHTIEINPKTNLANIYLMFDTGPRYYFGQVSFNQTPFALEFLNRFIPFKAGDPYSTDAMMKFQNNLNTDVYFQNAIVNPQINHAINNFVPINVNLTARKPQRISLGAGFNTDTGVRGLVGWEWRRVNSTGDYLQVLAQVSQRIQQATALQARYVIPGKNPVTDHYYITASMLANIISNISYIVQQGGVDYLFLANDWQHTLSLRYQHEISFGNAKNNVIPGIAWERVKAEGNRITTDNGYRVYLITQAGIQQYLQQSFLQAHFQGKEIYSYDHANRFVIRTELGYTWIKNADQLPLSQSFATGGAETVRGYGYQNMGPGSILVVGSAEYQRQLFGKIYGTVFFDAGNAVNRFSAINLQQGGGVGIVYRSPIGPMELTITRPFNIHHGNFFQKYRIQFAMGPDL
jgi:translocation and assembly module TamA